MPRRVLAIGLCALACAASARAATTTTGRTFTTVPSAPVYDAKGHLIQTPFAPTAQQPHLTKQQALADFLADGKVADWLRRYPKKGRTYDETFNAKDNSWKIGVWQPTPVGEVATGRVDDASGTVLEAWTGPQVAWKMARGYNGAFGGTKINDPWIWGAFCLAFIVGLADFRRPLSWRNLDLVVLLSFSVSLWYFNKGRVLTSVPLVYPPLVYLIGRALWVGLRGRGTPGRPLWPAWILLAAAVFL